MKKTLSVLLAALLLCSLCAIFAAAEDVNPDGYAFKVDTVNIAVAGEKTTIITKQDLIPSANMNFACRRKSLFEPNREQYARTHK